MDAFHGHESWTSVTNGPSSSARGRKCSIRRPAESCKKSNGWDWQGRRAGGMRRLQAPVLLAVCLDPRVIKLCDSSHITIPSDAVEAFEPAGSDFPFSAGRLEPRRGGNDPSPPRGASPIPPRGSPGKTQTRPCQTRWNGWAREWLAARQPQGAEQQSQK